MGECESFFDLLGLDPETDDWVVIEQRILERKRSWSRDFNQGNPKARRKAKRCLDLVPEITAVLKDPETRRQAAKEAKKRRQEARKKLLTALDEAIATLSSGGGTCDEAQLKRLEKRFADSLSVEEIKQRLRAAGIKLESSTRANRGSHPAREQIDKATAGTIRKNLEHLGLGTLYDLLERGAGSSPQALADRAEEIYRENQRLGKTDAESSARNELAGVCKRVFKDDTEKAKYDAYLTVAAMEGLRENIELAGADGFLSTDELNALVKQGMQRGVSAADARAHIEDYAAGRKWGVQPDAALPVEELKVCGFCMVLAPSDAASCPECGEALELSCPRCGTRNPTRNSACTSCGCRTGDAPLVTALLKEADRLVLAGDLAEADRCLAKALHYWPGWSEAEAARARLEQRRKDRDDELAAVEELVHRRQLVAARSALERFSRSHGSAGLDSLEQHITQGIAEAEALLKRGERARRQGDGDTALDRFDEALAACTDLEAARRAMAASPPSPPSKLTVTRIAGGFRLKWQGAATARRVSYRVLRKVGGVPLGTDDGELVGEVSSNQLDDTAAPVGEVMYYAVLAVRGGIHSPAGASSGPHLRTAEVSGLEALAGDGEVTLRWQAPPGCLRTEVWRQPGSPPQRPGDGQAVQVSGAGARDTGLTNGSSYGYLVVPYYADPEHQGTARPTSGHTITATPVALPAAVEDLRCSRQGRTVHLEWTPVAGASVQLRQTSQLPEYTPGLLLAVAQADRFGTLVPSSSLNGAQVPLSGQGQVFFVPISVAAGTAVVGRAVAVTNLDPVSNLCSRRSGRRIELTWDWPQGLDEVVIRYAADRYPDDPNSGPGTRVAVTRHEYERTGCWSLQHAEANRHYFSVFARAAGGDLYAAPAQVLESMGRASTVSYQVGVRKHLLRRSIEDAWLELQCSDGGCDALPALVVVGKRRAVPMSPADGQVLFEVPAVQLDRGAARIEIPDRHWRHQGYLKLFFKDASRAREIRLLPAAKEHLRLR